MLWVQVPTRWRSPNWTKFQIVSKGPEMSWCDSRSFWYQNKLWETLKQLGLPDHLTWETCMQDKKQQLEPDMEQPAGSKLGKKYNRLYKHFTCISCETFHMISCEMLGWKNYKLESRLLDIQGLWFWGEVWPGVLIMRLVNIKTVFTAKSLNEIIKKVSTDRKQKTSKN